jgi:hypothetical protein
LAGEKVHINVFQETLAVEYDEQTLAKYSVEWQPDDEHLLRVGNPRLYLKASRMIMRREHLKPDMSKVAPFSPAATISYRKPTVFASGRRFVARIVLRFATRGLPAYSR